MSLHGRVFPAIQRVRFQPHHRSCLLHEQHHSRCSSDYLNTPFTRSSWLDELLYLSWTSQLDVSSMLARCMLDVCSMSAWCLLDVCSMSARCLIYVCSMSARWLLDVCSTFARCLIDVWSSMFVWCLLDVCSTFVRCLLDVCSKFAWRLFNVCTHWTDFHCQFSCVAWTPQSEGTGILVHFSLVDFCGFVHSCNWSTHVTTDIRQR